MLNFLEHLADKSIIRKSDIAAIQSEAESTGASLDSILAKRGVSQEELLVAKSEYYKIPSREIGKDKIPFSILKYVPQESATHYKIAPLAIRDGVLEVGFVDPDDLDARDAVNFIASKMNMPFKMLVISEQDFEQVLDDYKGLSGEVTQALSELDSNVAMDDGIDLASAPQDEEGRVDARIIEDAPVKKIVSTILRYATEGNASDIHIEPMRENVRVRFRVDGTLNTSLVLPPNVLPSVVARIKVLCNMRLDEKRKPQDGRFSARIEGRKIDFRVSTFPTYFGEKVVMRILDQEKGVKPLGEMGISERNLTLLRNAITRPYGLILISGPTGSGKTTTLYSMLNEINRDEYNVLSLEDPIEYNVEGMSQSQVRPEIGYTFANGLRTTLRQDPDIIMVGEIRDKETAQLAVQAALTGHLVLSTIHTNNAAGVIPRLIDMGVDPFLIAPTLVIAVAQRLVRKRPAGDAGKVPLDGALRAYVDKELKEVSPDVRSQIKVPDFIYNLTPTPDCPTGTRGRTAVFEIISMDKELEMAIMKNASEQEVTKIARDQGMLTLREDALLKAFAGEIPFEEVTKL